MAPDYLRFIHPWLHKGKWLEIFLIGATVFFAAAYFCFPESNSEDILLSYPWWARKITFGNVQFYEFFFLLWGVFFGHKLLRKDFWDASIPIRASAFVLVALALWCGLISILNSPLPELDAGRSLRLLLNAAMLCAVFYWSQKKSTMLLAAITSGFFVGTVINLIISYQYPLIICGVLHMAGQNTPGVAMAVAIHMCAWLFSRTSSTGVKAFTVLALPIFIFGSCFSESKTAWVIAGLGIVLWGYIFFTAQAKNPLAAKILKIAKLVTVLSLMIPLAYFTIFSGKMLSAAKKNLEISQSTDACAEIASLAAPAPLTQNSPFAVYANSSSMPLQEFIRQLTGMIMVKYYGLAESNSIRIAYLKGTLEIITKHPLGVGYSGFYKAMINTAVYKRGTAAPEISIAEANPHSSFLWYTSAGGIPGGLMAIMLFIWLLKSMKTGLICALGKPGYVFFAMAALSFLAIGLIVPYMYNSIILIVPAAIAAGWTHQSRQRQ